MALTYPGLAAPGQAVPGDTTSAGTEYRSNPSTTVNSPNTDGPVALGVQFKVTADGLGLKGFRFFQPKSPWTGTVTATLYAVGSSTQLVTPVAVTVSQVGPSASSNPATPTDTYNAPNAFDGNTSTRWLGTVPTVGVPQWLRMTLGTAQVATGYTITPYASTYSPTAWKFQGSNDGSAWTDLDTRSGITWPTTAAQNFTFSNATAYLQYRILMTANNGATDYVAIAELGITGVTFPSTIPGWQEARLATPYALMNGTNYRAAFLFSSWWSGASGGMGTTLVNGPLTVPSSAAAVNGNDTYQYSASLVNPTTSVGSNYMLDVIVGDVGDGSVTGTVAATIGALTGSITGTVPVVTTGQVAATIPAMSGQLTGTSTVVGAVAGTVQVDAAASGTVAGVIGGVVDATIAVTAAIAGTAALAGAPLTSGLPLGSAHQGALRGSLFLPYGADGSQVLDFTTVPTIPESFDPWVIEGDGESRSLWTVVTATEASLLTVTFDAAFTYGLEAWTGEVGDGPDDLSEVAHVSNGPMEVPISAGQRVLLRAHPLLLEEHGTGTLSWTSAPRVAVGSLQLEVAPRVLETPVWLPVSVGSGTVDSEATFTLDDDPTILYTVYLDDSGQWAGSIPLPELTVGDHIVHITDTTTGQTVTATVYVQQEVPGPVALPGNNPPVTTPSPDPVIKWVFEDPAPGAPIPVYTFPINPSAMSNPLLGRTITADHSLSATGQPILWEGAPETVSWKVEGSVETQDHYEAMQAFYALDHRIWVIDHHQRAFIVSFESLEMAEKKSALNNWSYTYKATFLILQGAIYLGEA